MGNVSVEDLILPAVSREDEYFWLRDDSRTSEKVLTHLRQENAYTNYKTLPLRKFSERIYKELISHFKETDSNVPASRGKYAYYTRTVAGKSYKFYCRRPKLRDGSLGDEVVLLDVNALAARLNYCDVSACDVSLDDRFLAYSIDTSGYETYEIRFVDLSTNTLLKGKDCSINGTTGSFEWGHDSTRIFYQTMDTAHRPYKVWYRDMDLIQQQQQVVPSSEATAENTLTKDECLYTEEDNEFYLHASKSRSGRFLFIGSDASMTSEYRLVDLHSRQAPTTKLVRARQTGVLYDLTHARDDELYVVTNEKESTNFRVMRATVNDPSSWVAMLPYDEEKKIDGVHSFKNFAVIVGRKDGYKQMWILPEHDKSKMYVLPTEDDAHVVDPGANMEYEATTFQYSYMSLTIPKRVYQLDVKSGAQTILKQYEVPGYDSSLYATERLEAVSTDGVRIPISLVYRKDFVHPQRQQSQGQSVQQPENGVNDAVHVSRPVLLYGYGSYELSMEPSFSMARLPLLDRGVVYAIAHVRGGGEFGRGWYEAARLNTKKKTFEDFVSCAQHLVDCGRTKPEQLAIEGRSAGGLLVGAAMNMRPDLFRAVVAGVPFVDIMNTMSDASLPLTTGEWQEWGNPHTREYFDVMREYCPYSNIGAKDYPAMLVLAGLFDPRVHYVEPAKFVAKVRKFNKGKKDVLLKVDMSSGHFSASNRYHYLKERAFELSWVLNELGVSHEKLGE